MPETVRIYTTRYCGYCRAAKRLLSERGIAFDEIDVTEDAETRQRLVRETGQRTVPQIFIHGRSIGGFMELQALDAEDRLEPLLFEPRGE